MSAVFLTAFLTVLVYCTLLSKQIEGKIFDECELAQYLAEKSVINKTDIPTWVCIAYEMSQLNSNYHKGSIQNLQKGLFGISSDYWCTNSGLPGKGCNSSCDAFTDDDISDDVECATMIHGYERDKNKQNGFSAWNTYYAKCDTPDKVNVRMEKCFCP